MSAGVKIEQARNQAEGEFRARRLNSTAVESGAFHHIVLAAWTMNESPRREGKEFDSRHPADS
jgi:hypothetical protein